VITEDRLKSPLVTKLMPPLRTSVTALLRQNPNPSLEEIKQGCKGNFCRCGTYPHIFEAVQMAAKSKNV